MQKYWGISGVGKPLLQRLLLAFHILKGTPIPVWPGHDADHITVNAMKSLHRKINDQSQALAIGERIVKAIKDNRRLSQSLRQELEAWDWTKGSTTGTSTEPARKVDYDVWHLAQYRVDAFADAQKSMQAQAAERLHFQAIARGA